GVRVGYVILLVLGLLTAGGGFETYRVWATYSDMREGRAFLRAGQSRIEQRRLDSSADDLEYARTQFAIAGENFAQAHSRLDDDPAIFVARHLPFLSGQVDAAVSLSEIGESAAVIGEQGVAAADAFNAVRADPNGTLPEKTVRVFDGADPHIADINTRLTGVDAARAGLDDRSLLPPLRSAVSELDARQRRLKDFLLTYSRAHDFMPQFLGFDGPRTYLVLAQNQAELMPAGGLVSVVGTVRL